MKIAVTHENGEIFQHFGHTSQFKIYEITDGAVVSTSLLDTQGSGHGALATLLKQAQVNVLICGGIGGGAQMALSDAGIALYGGVAGDADQAITDFLVEKLVFNPNVKCNHHDHEHGDAAHACGDHGCGKH